MWVCNGVRGGGVDEVVVGIGMRWGNIMMVVGGDEGGVLSG